MRTIFTNFFRTIKSKSSIFIWVALLLLLLPSVIDIFKPGYFPMHDDLQVFRLYELHKCVLDWQIPCRWVPDAGFGYGYPLMQFYPPMPYYPMEIMVLLGAGFFTPVKIMFALAFIASGIGMFLLAKEFFGSLGGLLAAILYVYSPYHSVDIYVRGAMNEAWGMVWFPFVLLFIYRLIIKGENRWNLIFLSLATALQLTSHNVMTLVFSPLAVVWAIYWFWRTKSLSRLKQLLLAGFLGIGLSAFFFLPVILEQKYVHVDSMTIGYFNYLAHFADINQLFFSRFWGYGGSTWGPEDGMSFSVGQIQLAAALFSSLLAVIKLKKNKQLSIIVLASVFSGFIYAFLTHSRSNIIWEHLRPLQYAQFPWRLVALIVFCFSLAGGYLATIASKPIIRLLLTLAIILLTLSLNIGFFRFERHIEITLPEKLSGNQWELQVTGGIFDYLPRTAPKPPGLPAFTIPQFLEGGGGLVNLQYGTNWVSFEAHISSPLARIILPLYVYPGLTTKVDNKEVLYEVDTELGRVIIPLSQGTHLVAAKIGYTPIRLFSDLITFSSALLLIKLFFKKTK